MVRVSAGRPCPVCGKADWCLVSDDALRAICSRVDSPHRAGQAGWLHVMRDDPDDRPGRRPDRPPAPPQPPPPAADWRALAEGFAGRMTADKADALAAALGLPAACVDAVPLVGWNADDPLGPCWTFPEWDARGQVVGLLRRFAEPVAVGGGRKNKLLAPGGRRGVYLPHDWRATDVLLLVEGVSDVLAAAAVGMTAVGRPSNTGGGDILAELLPARSAGCRVYVLGENDAKADGHWPGRQGAEALHDRLTAAGIPARIAYPPAPHKDVRDWCRSLLAQGDGW